MYTYLDHHPEWLFLGVPYSRQLNMEKAPSGLDSGCTRQRNTENAGLLHLQMLHWDHETQ